MKKIIALLIVSSLFLSGCTITPLDDDSETGASSAVSSGDINSTDVSEDTTANQDSNTPGTTATADDYDEIEELNFNRLSDPKLLTFVEDTVYLDLCDRLGGDYFIEKVDAVYISQEYIDELTYNSQANIFFGFTLAELDEQFQGTKYVFTLGEDGQTVVQPMEDYDDTYDQVIRNVAIGTGVILLCVTVSAVTAGAGAPAASMIFAMAAQTGSIMAVSSAGIGGVSAGLVTGLQTGDWDQALEAGILGASEGFKMGAITGALTGGIVEGVGLHGATLNGLTMNEAATIQRESDIPLNLIREFESMDQYNIIRDSGMFGGRVDGSAALIRDIDLDFVDDMGRTNLERMREGLAALDPDGVPYELHHLGQSQDSVLAILTQQEHRGVGNHAIWHDLISPSQVDHGAVWDAQRAAFWRSFAARVA